MGQSTIDAVLAGTKSFAVALLAPLTARIGNRPRLAADPSQVLGLCSGPSALAVVEFTGEGSLGTIQALVRDGKGLRVVAGVPTAHAGAEGTLLALGVEVGRWDGKIDGVVLAVERAVTAMAAPPPSPPKPAVAIPKPTAPGVPAAAPRPAPAAAAPRPSSPAMAPAAPKPAAAAPGRAAAAAAPPVAQRTAAPAARLAVSPPVAPPARPGTTPAAPAAPTAPRVASASAPSPAPQRTGPPQPSPRVTPAADPPPPTLSRQPVPAPLATKPAPAAAPEPPASKPAPVAVSNASAVPAASPRLAASLFDDVEGDDVSIDEEPPAKLPDMHAPGVYVPPPPTARLDWPAGICGDAEAGDALRCALDGEVGDRPLHVLAARVVEAASDLERSVLVGKPVAVDPAPIRKAVVMRLRVADALASAPPTGSPVDTAALSSILGQIDALLAEVAPLLPGAPEELSPALESIRNALVSEAIDFSEAAQRVAAQVPAIPAAEIKGYSERRAAQARVLTSEKETEQDRIEKRKRTVWLVVAAALLVAVGGFHAIRYWQKSSFFAALPPPEVPGMQIFRSGGAGPVVLTPTGKVDKAALERFLAAQEALGKQVYEMQNGSFVVLPRGVPPPPGVKQ
jgi:hypothetical protein